MKKETALNYVQFSQNLKVAKVGTEIFFRDQRDFRHLSLNSRRVVTLGTGLKLDSLLLHPNSTTFSEALPVIHILTGQLRSGQIFDEQIYCQLLDYLSKT